MMVQVTTDSLRPPLDSALSAAPLEANSGYGSAPLSPAQPMEQGTSLGALAALLEDPAQLLKLADQLPLATQGAGRPLSLAALEERYIALVIQAVKGNKTQAAKLLGLDRRTLYRKLDRYAERDNGPKP